MKSNLQMVYLTFITSSLLCFAVNALHGTGEHYGLSVYPSGTVIAPVEVDFTLKCTLNFTSSSVLGHPILIWYQGSEPIEQKQMPESGNFSLVLTTPSFESSGVYSCGTQELGLLEMVSVQFGVPPSEPMNCQAKSTNILDIQVSWETENNQNNHIPTLYKFEYKTDIYDKYFDCPGDNYKPKDCGGAENSCVLEEHFYLCVAEAIEFKVTAMNDLGNKSCEFSFYPTREAIPNAPTELDIEWNQTWKITWQPPSDWRSSSFGLTYKILYWSEEQKSKNPTSREDLVDLNYDIKDRLDPYTWYHVSVAAKNDLYYDPSSDNDGWGESVEHQFLTAEVKPTVRLNVTIKEIEIPAENSELRDVLLQWELPSKEESGGIIRGYVISLSSLDINQIWNVTNNNSYCLSEYWIRNQVEKDEDYTIHIAAYNKKGISVDQFVILSAEDSPNISSGEFAAITAAVVVCLGLISIVGLSILIHYIRQKIKEADKIPNIPISIALELEADSNGYIIVDEANDRKHKVSPETFDSVVQESAERPDQARNSYSKYLQDIPLTLGKDDVSKEKVDLQPYVVQDNYRQMSQLEAENVDDPLSSETESFLEETRREEEGVMSHRPSSDGGHSEQSDIYSRLIFPEASRSDMTNNLPLNDSDVYQSNINPKASTENATDDYLGKIPPKKIMIIGIDPAKVSQYSDQSGYTAGLLFPLKSEKKIESPESVTKTNLRQLGGPDPISSDKTTDYISLPTPGGEITFSN